MSTIVVGIDGTGPMGTAEYDRQMRNSFVHYIVRHTPARHKRYLRGPGWDGLDMAMIAGEAYQFVHLTKAAHPDATVLLTGYSRGGSGVIDVARRLQRDGVTVQGMVLFDPVDRSVTSSGGVVPNNVLRLSQVRRDPASFSRFSFSNCADHWHHPTRCDRKHFFGTHGAMGGVPWHPAPGASRSGYISEGFPEPTPTLVTYDRDARAAGEVWAWIRPRLRSMGFLN